MMTAVGLISSSALLVVTASPLLTAQKTVGHPYYPLAAGNSWEYIVHASTPRRRESKVVWRVTKEDKAKSGRIVYQVWPTPMQADDEAMLLTVSDSGVEEMSSGTLVLKSPLSSGDHWAGGDLGRKGQPASSFKVVSVDQPCSARSKQFQDCAVVEEIDLQTQMRTIITYAKGVGPVEYKYFRMRPNGKQDEVQTVTLDSYKLAP